MLLRRLLSLWNWFDCCRTETDNLKAVWACFYMVCDWKKNRAIVSAWSRKKLKAIYLEKQATTSSRLVWAEISPVCSSMKFSLVMVDYVENSRNEQTLSSKLFCRAIFIASIFKSCFLLPQSSLDNSDIALIYLPCSRNLMNRHRFVRFA